MSKDPAFLFYSSDFLTGVSDLTFEERGQYITLLCLQHQKGRLSEKAIKIAVPNAAADVLAKFQKDEKGLFYNPRLEVEADKRAQHAEKQRLRAKKGWEKRKQGQSPGYATADATALPLENENVNENKDVNRRFSFKSKLMEAGAEKKLCEDWLKVRKAKKAANTETALKGFLSEVEKSGKTIDEILTICIENSWKGFKASWIETGSAEKEKTTLDKLKEMNRQIESGQIKF